MSGRAVVIRADASPSIGLGHVARCRAVAVALRAREVGVALATHGLPESMRSNFARIGCDVFELQDPVDPMEVVQVLERAGAAGPSATLLVDHYGIDAEWESVLRPSTGKLAAIEDRPVRRHDVDLLIDAAGGLDRPMRYSDLLPDDAQIVTGHDFAIIDPLYARLRRNVTARNVSPQRVLVQLGSDRSALVVLVLQAILELGRPELELDVVVQGDHPHLHAIRGLASANGWQVHSDVESIWCLYARVDLAVAAPGVSVWERCALGVPSIVIETTPMHVGAYKDLNGSPAVTLLGTATRLTLESLVGALGRELDRKDLRQRFEACQALIDGRGADRVASLLAGDVAPMLRLRDAHSQDKARVSRWVNARNARFRLSNQAPLPVSEGHVGYVLEDNWGSEMGAASFTMMSDGWELSVAMAPGYRDQRFVELLVDLGRWKLREDLGEPCSVVTSTYKVPLGAGPVLTRLGFSVSTSDDRSEALSYEWKGP